MTNSLLTKEVTNFNLLTFLINSYIDGEVSIYETHLVTITMSNTGNHIVNMRTDGTNNSNILVETEP